MDLGLHGRVALVTGGSRGVGREIAVTLAREGASVAVCGRDRTRLRAVQRELDDYGIPGMVIEMDLISPEACKRAVDQAGSAFGRLDILVNNASTSVDHVPPRFEDTADEHLLERIQGKLMMAIRCSRAALPYFRVAGGGRIICIGGLAARNTRPTAHSDAGATMPSGLANAALVNFAKHLSAEVARDRILVNTVHPVSVRTDRFVERVRRRASVEGTDEAAAEAHFAGEIPIGRMIEPSDIAPLVALLASPLAAAITGQSIAVDGGMSSSIVY